MTSIMRATPVDEKMEDSARVKDLLASLVVR